MGLLGRDCRLGGAKESGQVRGAPDSQEGQCPETSCWDPPHSATRFSDLRGTRDSDFYTEISYF